MNKDVMSKSDGTQTHIMLGLRGQNRLPILVPVYKIGIPFTHPQVEPRNSCANHMAEKHPN